MGLDAGSEHRLLVVLKDCLSRSGSAESGKSEVSLNHAECGWCSRGKRRLLDQFWGAEWNSRRIGFIVFRQ